MVGLTDAFLGRRRGMGGWGEVLTLAPCSSEVWAGRMVGEGESTSLTLPTQARVKVVRFWW